jgi:TrmH family RNA methyltransferase
MVSKAQSKRIRSLADSRSRRAEGAFVVEGDKLCGEWLRSPDAQIESLVCTEVWAAQNRGLLNALSGPEVFVEPEHVLQALSNLTTPSEVLLVAALPEQPSVLPTSGWCLALDTIQDPGNMGTILRIADWFGIPDVVCSPGCADAFAPKVIQAGMGAQLRVRVHSSELLPFISSVTLPVLAAALNGENVYAVKQLPEAVLLIGNESRGLSDSLLEAASHRVTIPRRGGAESLNAAVSAGILCALLIEH